MYASSVFSWQPWGDTSTRRAFYDSWMFGSIPVIHVKSAHDYENIFRGLLFRAAGIALNDTALVLDGYTFCNGERLLEVLACMPMEEIERRCSNMRMPCALFTGDFFD